MARSRSLTPSVTTLTLGSTTQVLSLASRLHKLLSRRKATISPPIQPNRIEGEFSEGCLRKDEHGVMVVGGCITLRLICHARRVPRDAGGATRRVLPAGRLRSPL